MADVGDQQSAPLSDPGLPRLAIDDEQRGSDAESAPARPQIGPEGNGNPATDRPPAEVAALEARVRRLEKQLVSLQDSRLIEQRVVERLRKRLRRAPATTQVREPSAPCLPAAAGMAGQDNRSPETAGGGAADAMPSEAAPSPAAGRGPDGGLPGQPPASIVTPVGERQERRRAPIAMAVVAPLAKAVAAPLAVIAPVAVAVPAAPLALTPAPAAEPSRFGSRFTWIKQQTWLLLETATELRIIWRMFTDPRYRPTWISRLAPVAFLLVFCFSDWPSLQMFFPWTVLPPANWLGWFLNKLVLLILGFIAFKALTREVERYKETIPDAPGKKHS